MTLPAFYRPVLILTCVLAAMIALQGPAWAQSIHLVPDPEGFDCDGKLTVFDGKLYFRYLSTSPNLACFDGTAITLIPNPPKLEEPFKILGAVESFVAPDRAEIPFMVGNGMLYQNLRLNRGAGENTKDYRQLAKFDGHAFTLLANPAGGRGYAGQPVFYQGRLHFLYNVHPRADIFVTKLARLDDDGIHVLPNPDEATDPYGSFDVEGSYDLPMLPTEFHGKIYFSYRGGELAEFDGAKVRRIPNPQNIDGGRYDGRPIVYHENLYLAYGGDLMRFDGQRITRLALPALAHFRAAIMPVLYRDKLLLWVTNPMTAPQLAEYDGAQVKLIANPAGFAASPAGAPIVFDGKLYLRCAARSGLQSLGVYDGTEIRPLSHLTNPSIPEQIPAKTVVPAPLGYAGNPIPYHGKLYFYFLRTIPTDTTGLTGLELARLDGETISIMPTRVAQTGPGGCQPGAVVYHEKLYFNYAYYDAALGRRVSRLAYFDDAQSDPADGSVAQPDSNPRPMPAKSGPMTKPFDPDHDPNFIGTGENAYFSWHPGSDGWPVVTNRHGGNFRYQFFDYRSGLSYLADQTANLVLSYRAGSAPTQIPEFPADVVARMQLEKDKSFFAAVARATAELQKEGTIPTPPGADPAIPASGSPASAPAVANNGGNWSVTFVDDVKQNHSLKIARPNLVGFTAQVWNELNTNRAGQGMWLADDPPTGKVRIVDVQVKFDGKKFIVDHVVVGSPLTLDQVKQILAANNIQLQ